MKEMIESVTYAKGHEADVPSPLRAEEGPGGNCSTRRSECCADLRDIFEGRRGVIQNERSSVPAASAFWPN